MPVPLLRMLLPFALVGSIAVSSAAAQAVPSASPPVPLGPNVSLVSKNVFSLPVLLDQSAISNLREIELYVRRRPTEPWKLSQSIKPTERAFVFKASEDGEYQFAVVGVDKQGRKSVPNLASKAADSMIAIDTQPPQVTMEFAGDMAEGVHVNCTVADANANPFATEFHYQTRDGQWHRLLPLPNQPERYCIPQAAALTGLVKVNARDRAGNQAARELNLSQARLLSTRMPYAERPPTGVASPLDGKNATAEPPLPTASYEPAPLPLPPEPRNSNERRPLPTVDTSNRDMETLTLAPPPEPPIAPPLPPPSTFPETAYPKTTAPPPVGYDALRVPSPSPSQNEPLALPAECAPPMSPEMRQFINRPRVYLAYEIDRPATGASKIQIWITRDQGKSWTHLGDDPDGKSPAEIRLPAEGVTGVRLLAGNQPPPTAVANTQDGLTSWIELDVTKPAAEMRVQREPAALVVQWNVREKNPAADPVDLYYAQDMQGPWLAMAAGLPATGEFRWEVPPQLAGKQLHVRLVASDAAGNVAQVEEGSSSAEPGPQAIAPPPPSPRVRFLGVSSSPQQVP